MANIYNDCDSHNDDDIFGYNVLLENVKLQEALDLFSAGQIDGLKDSLSGIQKWMLEMNFLSREFRHLQEGKNRGDKVSISHLEEKIRSFQDNIWPNIQEILSGTVTDEHNPFQDLDNLNFDEVDIDTTFDFTDRIRAILELLQNQNTHFAQELSLLINDTYEKTLMTSERAKQGDSTKTMVRNQRMLG